MKKKGRHKISPIRLGVEYALRMMTRFSQKKKPSGKAYSRKKKHRKAGTDIE